ncbi:peptidyl-prolyl cis-trans isomerase ssp-1 [Aureobasidium sp. EXF-3400]|nr:peptidyl-prolyl cis-trans isomerase ssp-1 [Aureobasidium sp. EXF-3400]
MLCQARLSVKQVTRSQQPSISFPALIFLSIQSAYLQNHGESLPFPAIVVASTRRPPLIALAPLSRPSLTHPSLQATGLPSGWEVRHSNSKNLPYYFNPSTKESRWEPPSGTDSETLKHYMGTYHSSASLRPDGQGQQEGKIRASHLLVKHRDSRRPSSWREAQITRSKDDAMTIILGHEARIRSGATSLGDLATTESDCSSSRKRGDLGFFAKGDMQKEFEDAAFALKPGEVSHVVATASGLHLIERLE